jgi:hypothetical protein
MFSPNLGRWMTMDPIAYEAGDTNLYRYVGNDPVNGLDPNGMQEKSPTIGGSSGQIPELTPILPRLFTPPGKDEILKGVPFRREKDLEIAPNQSKSNGVSGDEFWSGEVPEGWLSGPRGCGPCVGVALVPDKPGKIYVLHYSASGNVHEGLIKCGFLSEKRVKVDNEFGRSFTVSFMVAPKCYKAILCGSEHPKNDTEADNVRLRTLREVCNTLTNKGVKIECYVPAPAFGVGKDGKIYWTTPRNQPVENYEK